MGHPPRLRTLVLAMPRKNWAPIVARAAEVVDAAVARQEQERSALEAVADGWED
jgi:hypothetical protein